MHWTSYLAYRRRFNPDAQIIGDLGCAGCGYNLRGLRVAGNCPECGQPIANSMYVLTQPALVGSALHGFSNSYLTFLIMVVGCIGGLTAADWTSLVTALALGFGAAYRVWCATELRFRGELTNSEALSQRVAVLWFTSLIELLAALAWLGLVIVIINTPTLQTQPGRAMGMMAGGVWLLLAMVNAGVAGWFAVALASRLGYGWLVIELRAQRWAVMVAVALAALGLVTVLPLAIPTPVVGVVVLFAAITGLVFLVAYSLTWLSLHHTANAAEHSTDALEDLLDTA